MKLGNLHINAICDQNKLNTSTKYNLKSLN